MIIESLARFRVLVLQNRALQERLREIEDREEFIAQVVTLGQAQGYEFSAQDVTEGLRAGQRAWLERWI